LTGARGAFTGKSLVYTRYIPNTGNWRRKAAVAASIQGSI